MQSSMLSSSQAGAHVFGLRSKLCSGKKNDNNFTAFACHTHDHTKRKSTGTFYDRLRRGSTHVVGVLSRRNRRDLGMAKL